MTVIISAYTKDNINQVVDFENQLRQEENFWGWEIDEEYLQKVTASFDDPALLPALSFLAWQDGKVIGRIDASLIESHFDGSTKAYLDWICVLKSCRHRGVAQLLLQELRQQLKKRQVDTLIALTASNEEAQSFYRHIPDSIMRDIGIWIDIK